MIDKKSFLYFKFCDPNRNIMFRLFFKNTILFLLGLGCYTSYAQHGIIEVTAGDLTSLKGSIIIELLDSATVYNRKSKYVFKQKTIRVTSQRMVVRLDSVPAGLYTIAVIHDVNQNGKLDYFTEDYGYSNAAISGGYGPPSRIKSSFHFNGDSLALFVHMENELAGKTMNDRKRTALTPVSSYTPETSVMLGANFIHLFRSASKDSIARRTSYIDFFTAVTLKKQFILENNYLIFDKNEKYMFIGYSIFQKFPQYYYGVGNNLPASNKELISYNILRLDHLVLRNVYKKMYIGAGFTLTDTYNVSGLSDGLPQENQVIGANGAFVSGIQAAVSSDNRNSIYNTSKGHLVRVKFVTYDKALGSQYNFYTFETDIRKFIRPFKKRKDILAFQAYGFFSSGQVPWNEMGALGSDMIMRGYYSGRYRDKNYAAIQAEYRLQLNNIFGLTFFAGTGEVAAKMNQFTFNGLKPNAGAGARLMLDRQERLNLRFDIGFGKNTSNIYISVTEAF